VISNTTEIRDLTGVEIAGMTDAELARQGARYTRRVRTLRDDVAEYRACGFEASAEGTQVTLDDAEAYLASLRHALAERGL